MTGGMNNTAVLAENTLTESTETEISKFIEHLVGDTKVLIGDTLLETKEEQEIRECLEMGNF